MYCCNFDLIGVDGQVITKMRGGSCFSGTYLNLSSPNNYFLNIYALKEYKAPYLAEDMKSNQFNIMQYTSEEIDAYIKALGIIGFNVSVEDSSVEVNYGNIYQKNMEECAAYKFIISLKDNTCRANMVLVNLLRNLYETPYVAMSRWFIDSLKIDEPEVTLLDRLLMCHSVINVYNNGHTICTPRTPLVLSNKDEVETMLFVDNNICNSSSMLQTKAIYGDRIYTLINDEKLTLLEKKKQYKEICAKYM